MNGKDSFKSFANRVTHAMRMGKLPERDIKTVQNLLRKTETKNLILSRALLTTLAGGDQSEQDVKRFAHLLDLANRRMGESKDPFSVEEKGELEGIFKRHSLSTKAAKKFALGINELLVMELRSQMEITTILPKKQDVHLPVSGTKSEQKEKLAH